jgi:Mrp family chromosome partitioning ATPase
MPFIEVGPRRSVEGSPEVLASAPPLRVHTDGGPPVREQTHVLFQPLPTRTARPERAPFAPELVAYHAPDLPAGQQYRSLLGSLLQTQREGGRHCALLLFTASRPGLGATTIVLNVAITAARQGRRPIVVIDANLRRPAVAERLGLPAVPGLRDVLAGTAALDQALQPTNQENLLALTAGLGASGPGPRFVAQTVRSLLRQLRQRADLIFIDGPCWDGRAEAATLASAADVVYPVFPEKDAETAQSDTLVQSIAEQGGHVSGCILAGR